MAVESIVSVTITDDLTGAKGANTVEFALNGKTYEIDLTPGNQRALERSLSKYIAAARITPPRRTGFAGPRKGIVRADVRRWAVENGHDISDKGRISYDILAAYEKYVQGGDDTVTDSVEVTADDV